MGTDERVIDPTVAVARSPERALLVDIATGSVELGPDTHLAADWFAHNLR